MDKHPDLSGTLVLVYANLTNDPSNKKNQIGVITEYDLENNSFLVDFGYKGQALLSAQALLVLRNLSEIERDAANDATLLPYEDYQDLMGVIAFATSATPVYQRLAIELARTNPTVLEYTMTPLSRELGLKRDYGFSR